MADLEKVIRGLECCVIADWDCTKCPYGNPGTPLKECHDKMLADALALLRELKQEEDDRK